MNNLVTVKIPGPSASRSKMQKKGWKCWCKNLAEVATPANNGYAYLGEFVSVDAVAELAVGDVLLHVDESSNSGIGVVQPDGEVSWEKVTNDAKWVGPLAATARKLLAMTPAERVRPKAGAAVAATRQASDRVLKALADLRDALVAEKALWVNNDPQCAGVAIDDALHHLSLVSRCVSDINDSPESEQTPV